MNDLEWTLYTKGLENLYGSVLLGEESALNCIENMVYLTREIQVPAGARHSLANEAGFIRKFCEACWPNTQVDIRLEGDISGTQITQRQLSEAVCGNLMKIEQHGRIPCLVVLWQEAGQVCYRLEEDGQIWAQGEVSLNE